MYVTKLRGAQQKSLVELQEIIEKRLKELEINGKYIQK